MFDFESILDECGYHFKETLQASMSKEPLWEVIFDVDSHDLDGSFHKSPLMKSKDTDQ